MSDRSGGRDLDLLLSDSVSSMATGRMKLDCPSPSLSLKPLSSSITNPVGVLAVASLSRFSRVWCWSLCATWEGLAAGSAPITGSQSLDSVSVDSGVVDLGDGDDGDSSTARRVAKPPPQRPRSRPDGFPKDPRSARGANFHVVAVREAVEEWVAPLCPRGSGPVEEAVVGVEETAGRVLASLRSNVARWSSIVGQSIFGNSMVSAVVVQGCRELCSAQKSHPRRSLPARCSLRRMIGAVRLSDCPSCVAERVFD